MEEDIVVKKREPILKADKATADSDTIIKMKIAEKQLIGKKGISFYCSKRHSYICIENERGQSNHFAPIFQKVELSVQDITSKEKLKQWQEQD